MRIQLLPGRHYCRKLRLSALALACCFALAAQTTAEESSETEAPSTFQPALSIGLSSGTHAFIGADVTLGLFERIQFRIAYNRLKANPNSFTINAATFGFKDQELLLDTDVNLSTLGLLADVPLNPSRNIRLMGGLMVNLNNNITVTGQFQEGITLNDYVLPPERIGQVTGQYTTNSAVYPYLGFGFGRSIAEQRLSFNFEAGAFLRGRPTIDFSSTGLLQDNSHNGPILSENFSSLRLHPSLSLRLAYRINVPAQLMGRSPAEMPMPAEAEIESEIEQPQEAPQAPQAPQAPAAKPSSGQSPMYIVLQGSTTDALSGNSVSGVYLDLYLIAEDGSRSLERTGRYPKGAFIVGLKPGHNYELLLTAEGYHDLTKAFFVKSGDTTLTQTFAMTPQ